MVKINWIEGRGYDSNIYLLQGKRNLLIDAGTGKNFERLRKEMERLGKNLREIDILVNTHAHFDHVGGNQKIIDASDCELMASGPTAEVLEAGGQGESLASHFGEKLEPLKVSRRLQDGDEIDIGYSTLEILTTPGHSRGDIVLYIESDRILFSGDTVFKGGIGRTDLPSSDAKEMRKSLDRLKELDVEKLYPGHGPIAETDGGKHIERASSFLI
ncbi:hypothetical protein AKJ52_01935 [candidate division MSBL1 archaeon SCGC-AAA382C18]|uniref:Metallo-beta-lactamase domain-containing protein n=1 Tax=candidate division MSBL1 archaeon SCGC-AAA382C18 TaxID=1698281 RepID=A0A133VJN0_9EURY|nr:hypothetical protein AKJ52_01935 [candidate division MSBL1 archaeon SCGC-AAA382C18]